MGDKTEKYLYITLSLSLIANICLRLVIRAFTVKMFEQEYSIFFLWLELALEKEWCLSLIR